MDIFSQKIFIRLWTCRLLIIQVWMDLRYDPSIPKIQPKNARLTLRVIEDIPAGRNPKKPIQNDQTSRIMTGAPLPPNADAVIPVELSNFSDRYNEQILPKTVEVYQAFNKGDNVRTKGMDVFKGEKLFEKGHLLKSHDLGFISGLGIDSIKIYPPPKIALFSSGNEIVKAGKQLKPGQIFDINSISILNLLQSFGAEVIELGTAKDNYAKIKKLFEKAVEFECRFDCEYCWC